MFSETEYEKMEALRAQNIAWKRAKARDAEVKRGLEERNNSASDINNITEPSASVFVYYVTSIDENCVISRKYRATYREANKKREHENCRRRQSKADTETRPIFSIDVSDHRFA